MKENLKRSIQIELIDVLIFYNLHNINCRLIFRVVFVAGIDIDGINDIVKWKNDILLYNINS